MFTIMKIFLTLLMPYAKKAIVVSKTLFSKNGIILISPLAIAMPIFTGTPVVEETSSFALNTTPNCSFSRSIINCGAYVVNP